MRKSKLTKKLIGGVTAAAAAFTCLLGAWAAEIPQLNFRNEKVTGLTVTKEIFRTESDTVPLRSGNDEDKLLYSANSLDSDEFKMYLWGGSSTGSMTAVKSLNYTRTNKYGDYYRCMNAVAQGEDVIIVPVSGEYGYKAYYYNSGIRSEYEPEKNGAYYKNAERTANEKSAYMQLNIGERFVYDYFYGEDKFSTNLANLTKYFETDSQGTFYLSDGNDGDQVYFKKFEYERYSVTENTDLLKTYNESKETGVYDATVSTLTDENGMAKSYIANDANEFEVKNYFDKPHDALKINKSVPYFGTITNPINEDFTFELLVKDKTPEGYSYRIFNGSTEISSGIFGSAATSTTPAEFTLKGGERMEVYGIMKNKTVTVREILVKNGVDLNPSYTALRKETAADQLNGQEYKYHEEVRNGKVTAYIEWEGNFDVEKENSSVTNFVNVPNVMLVTKKLETPQAESYDFEFEIKRWSSTANQYVSLAENEQMRYYKRSGSGEDFFGDSNSNGEAFVTKNGTFTVKDGQTAMFFGLREGEKYQITETRALLNGTNVTAYFDMDTTPQEHTARPLKESAGTYSLSSDTHTFNNRYEPPTGLFITKDVIDEYGRVKANAEYSFKLTKSDNSEITFADTAKIKIGTVEEYLTTKLSTDKKTISFSLKNGESAQIKGLPFGNYIVTEDNPNKESNCNDDKFQRLFTVSAQVDDNIPKIYYAAGTDNHEAGGASTAAFDLTTDSARSITFTNTTKELKYYFDVEKIIYADRNAHGDAGEAEQRFVFKIERFDEDETDFSDSHIREVFYTDLSCDKEMTFDNGTLKLEGDDYIYTEGLYTAEDYNSKTNSAFLRTDDDVRIKKSYTDMTDNSSKTYIYPAKIYNGRRSVMVTKKGIYRISEVPQWSLTDYDFWHGSNQYKGYKGTGQGKAYADFDNGGTSAETEKPLKIEPVNNSVLISVTGTKAYLFDKQSFTNIDDKGTDDTSDDTTETWLRPTASFTNSESEFAYLSSQSWAENYISRGGTSE